MASPRPACMPLLGWSKPPIGQPVESVQIVKQETGNSTLHIHHHRARVKMNADLSGCSSVLSRLGDKQMLIAPQSRCTLIWCMLPSIFSTTVGFVVSAATASALLVCLLAFVEFLWMPRRWWWAGTASPSGLIGLDWFKLPGSRLFELSQMLLWFALSSGFLRGC